MKNSHARHMGRLAASFLAFLLLFAYTSSIANSKTTEVRFDCSSQYGFELDPKISLFDLKVLDVPTRYEKDGYYLSVRSFDTDFQPERKGGMGGMAIVSAGGLELSDPVAGGMVLAREAAYFNDEMSRALNKKNGKLNAVFLIALNDDKCGGKPFVITFDKTGLLSLDGKKLVKVEVSPQ